VRIIDEGLGYGSEGRPVIADHSHEPSFLTDSHLALRPGSAISRPMQQERLKPVDSSSESRFLTARSLELVPQLQKIAGLLAGRRPKSLAAARCSSAAMSTLACSS
jgi:hypothetical protein